MSKGVIKCLILLLFALSNQEAIAQKTAHPIVEKIKIEEVKKSSISYCWLTMGENAYNQPILVPVIIAKGKYPGPTVGIIAGIHGNELNGIPVIQNILDQLELKNLNGTILAIPGINPISLDDNKRRFPDEEDLNRLFPGKNNGNESQQFVYQIDQKILPHLDYLFDLHTASFGRVNSMYVRADVSNDTLEIMADAIGADILLKNKGVPSFGEVSSSTVTMRAQAARHGTHAITIELGNPQVYQSEMTLRGVNGITNALIKLNILNETLQPTNQTTILCKKSYWIYTDRGGFLDIPVELAEVIKKNTVIGILKDPFGKVIKEYLSPEDGVIIGKSSNPVNTNGGRIIHLGILE